MKVNHVAILWDWQNVRASADVQLDAVVSFAQQFGAIARKLVYAHWRVEQTKWEELFEDREFECLNAIASKSRPNNADRKLIHTCQRDILKAPDIQTVILISGDGDFKSLVKQLKQAGKRVIVITRHLKRASQGLVRSADRVYELGKL